MRPSVLARSRTLLALAGGCLAPACGSVSAGSLIGPESDGGAFGRPSALDAATEYHGDLGLDGAAGTGGPSASARLVHAIPNLGRVVLCHFAELALDDVTTVDVDELDRTRHAGRLLLSDGVGFGEVSAWLSVPVTGVLTLHRVLEPLADAGVGALDAGALDAGLDASSASDAALDAGLDAASADAALEDDDPCDPARLEVALPLPMPEGWLASDAPGDGGRPDAGVPSEDAGDGAVDPLAERGIARTLVGGAQLTLFASGLLLDRDQLAQRAEGVRSQALAQSPREPERADQAARDAVAALDRQFGPRLVASPPATPTDAGVAALALAHAIPDALAAGLRACITTDGVDGRALPSVDTPPVAFRERVALGRELSPASSYRVRVFAADAFAVAGQDCANTTRAPLASLDGPAPTLAAGSASTLLMIGLLSPEALCSAGAPSALARPGCFGSVPPALRAVLLDD